MKYTLLLFIFLLTIDSVSAQLLYPEVMQARPPLMGPVVGQKYRNSSLPFNLYRRRLNDYVLDNPGVRYAVQNLRREPDMNGDVKNAINTLLKYAGNDRLKYIVESLQRYTHENMPVNEQALEILQQQITSDSIVFLNNQEFEDEENVDTYQNTDLQTFLGYIRSDSNYTWLKNASRDSIFTEIINLKENSVKFWMNNGKMSFHRFWAANKLGDTIGTWIQVFPKGNRLKFYVDEDVYQNSGIEKKTVPIEQTIPNTLGKEYFVIKKPHVGTINRRNWTYYSEVEVAMSQGKLANWASGGENSLSLLSNLRYYLNYNHNKTSWENWVHYRFGFMKNGNEDMRKNEDRFELNSKVGQKAFKHWYYTAQFNTLTQLFKSYEYPSDKDRVLVANFMSPGYFTLSLGMDYKPHSNFSLMVSPIAGKWNFVRDTSRISAKRYGVEEGKRYKREAGAQINLFSKLNNLLKIMDMNNELKVFMSYEKKDRYINKGKKDEEKKNIPITANWKLTLYFKINYFMSASIYTETIYDENYSKKIQFKENLNLGVKFRF